MLVRIAGTLLALAVSAMLTPSHHAAAQATPPSGTPTPQPAIPPVVWQLTAIQLADGGEQVPGDPANYTLQFLPDDTALIRADCNQGSGDYEIDGNRLDIANIITTLVGCPPGSIGDDYVQRLDEAVSFSYDEGALVFALPSDAGVLRFAATLTGVVWHWQGFEGGDGSTVVPDDPAKYTLQFLPDGTVLIRADCNQGSGTYTADDASLTISDIVMTRVACPPGSLSTEFVSDLEEVVSYVFREGNLYLALMADAGIHEFTAHVVDDEQGTPTASPIASEP